MSDAKRSGAGLSQRRCRAAQPGVRSRADWEAAVRAEPYSREVPQLTRIEADWSGRCRTMTCGSVLWWTGCLLMACKRSGVRVSVAPRFRRSEAICADLDRLLIVQEVILSGELA
jgi:hypothetical protein